MRHSPLMQAVQEKVGTHWETGSIPDERVERLAIPKDLSGQSFLDIGCGNGAFCDIAAARGASTVIGVDIDSKTIEAARSSHPKCEFIETSWATLPPGRFDVVLWSSAMHYERDPVGVLNEIYDRLSDDGLLILECGSLDRSAKELIQIERPEGAFWYPTIRLLTEVMLDKFTSRCLSYGVVADGDPIPRYVFHCRKRMPTVILVRGASKAGKSALSDCLTPAYSKILQLDMVVSRVAGANHHHNDLEKKIRDLKASSTGLGAVYDGIDGAGMTEQFARMIAQAVAPSDKLVVIEGAVSEHVAEALAKIFRGSARFWQMERGF